MGGRWLQLSLHHWSVAAGETAWQAALRELNEEQRTLVVLRDIENLTYDEIQDVTGLPAGTVKSRLHRARLALAERVRELRASGTMDEEGS